MKTALLPLDELVCENAQKYTPLTVGNTYVALEYVENKVYVIDDNGKRNSFYISRFKPKNN